MSYNCHIRQRVEFEVESRSYSWWGGLGLWCFTPLSTILLLYRGGRFYWWWNRSIPRKNTDLSQVNDKLIPGGDKDIYRGKNRESTTICFLQFF
jgi:hypothetical protein